MPNRRANKNKRSARQVIENCKRISNKVSELNCKTSYLDDMLAGFRGSIRELNIEIYNLKQSAHQPAQQELKVKKWWQFYM